MELAYVLPIKSSCTDGDDELTEYLTDLRELAEVVVVDGSPWYVFQSRARRWRGLVTHIPPAADLQYRNGKVNGVLTGLRASGLEKIVIADEDVRYDADALARISALLERFDLVRPQNYFEPLPWHARWDTARTLLNRLTAAGDYPGTLAVRRLPWLVEHGYDGNVLFENLELLRTVAAHGGSAVSARDLFVRRLPPSAGHFLRQRVRQAYDSHAQPVRMVAELAVLPAVLAVLYRRRPVDAAVGAAASMLMAEVGRRRNDGAVAFPASAALLTPVWLLERGLCSWLALGRRVLFGGVRYSGSRLRVAAHSERNLREQVGHLREQAGHLRVHAA